MPRLLAISNPTPLEPEVSKERVGGRGLASSREQNTGKKGLQHCVPFWQGGIGKGYRKKKRLNLWHGKDLLAPTPSVRQPLFETSGSSDFNGSRSNHCDFSLQELGKSKWGLWNGVLRPLSAICAQSSTIVPFRGPFGPLLRGNFPESDLLYHLLGSFFAPQKWYRKQLSGGRVSNFLFACGCCENAIFETGGTENASLNPPKWCREQLSNLVFL